MKTERRRLGDIGENVACVFLEKHGYRISDRNYLRKWGEIDIVARKGGVVHFVEVKSMRIAPGGVVGGVKIDSSLRPEENMHPVKIARLHRAIQTYLLEKKIDEDWQLDLVVVRIDESKRVAKAEILENIV